MAKAMLLMDKSSSCGKCDISQKVKSKCHVRCPVLKRIVYKFEDCIPNDCPLREVPQKRDFINPESVIAIHEDMGYNACIDEILGGGE